MMDKYSLFRREEKRKRRMEGRRGEAKGNRKRSQGKGQEEVQT